MEKRVPFFTNFIYCEDSIVDSVINRLIDKCEIYEIDVYCSWMTITFRKFNPYEIYKLEVWNSTKWSGWLNTGNLSFFDKSVFSWKYARPKRKTMNRLLKKINEFHESKNPIYH